MADSIYKSLYKYPSTDKRSQMENFLTEAFVNILNRMEKSETISFLKECILKDCNDTRKTSDFIAKLEDVEEFSWTTQYTIHYEGVPKYPDIALLGNGLLLLIENKIGSGFTYHQEEIADNEIQEKRNTSFDNS